ncbi:MAG: hypothetical protein JW778_05035 [Candidatus Altiarchaeota archaeon]|nr:hypothetical protein [Candidatus Altiarchaeota archaeon]
MKKELDDLLMEIWPAIIWITLIALLVFTLSSIGQNIRTAYDNIETTEKLMIAIGAWAAVIGLTYLAAKENLQKFEAIIMEGIDRIADAGRQNTETHPLQTLDPKLLTAYAALAAITVTTTIITVTQQQFKP